jgi:hypothetical protein
MNLLLSLLSLLVVASTDAFVHRPFGGATATLAKNNHGTSLRLLEPSHLLDEVLTNLVVAVDPSALDGPPEMGGVSYSKASYYTILGLYLLSFPGLWSTVKRSTTAKVKRKTFVTQGEESGDGKSLRQEAGEIMACQ